MLLSRPYALRKVVETVLRDIPSACAISSSWRSAMWRKTTTSRWRRGRSATMAQISPAGPGALFARGERMRSRRSKEARQSARRLQLRATRKTQPLGDCICFTRSQRCKARAKASSVHSAASAKSPVTRSIVARTRGCSCLYQSAKELTQSPPVLLPSKVPDLFARLDVANRTEALSHEGTIMLIGAFVFPSGPIGPWTNVRVSHAKRAVHHRKCFT